MEYIKYALGGFIFGVFLLSVQMFSGLPLPAWINPFVFLFYFVPRDLCEGLDCVRYDILFSGIGWMILALAYSLVRKNFGFNLKTPFKETNL